MINVRHIILWTLILIMCSIEDDMGNVWLLRCMLFHLAQVAGKNQCHTGVRGGIAPPSGVERNGTITNSTKQKGLSLAKDCIKAAVLQRLKQGLQERQRNVVHQQNLAGGWQKRQ